MWSKELQKKYDSLSVSEKETVDGIAKMSQIEMARLWRFAPTGHPYFNGMLPYSDFFEYRFKKLGGITPEISKELGW